MVGIKDRLRLKSALMRKTSGKIDFFCFLSFVAILSSLTVSIVTAQEDAPKRLAPGVMRTIRPFINYSETNQWAEIPELVAEAADENDDSFDWAKNLYFSKEIWCLEFSFKPVRFAKVDIPNVKGEMDRKTVWYMVYSVTNTGKRVGCGVAQPADDKTDIMVRDGDPRTAPLTPMTVVQRANNLDGVYVINEIDYLKGTSQKMELKEEEKGETKDFTLQPLGEPVAIDLTPDEDGRKPGTVRFSPRFILVSRNIIGELEYTRDENGFYVSRQGDKKEGDGDKKDGDGDSAKGVSPAPAASSEENSIFYDEVLRSGNRYYRQEGVWNDQFLPLALAQIGAIEDPNQRFENSVTIAAKEIAPGETVWGIATWTDVDPRINDFTVYVSGLTNALRWTDDDEAFKTDNVPMTGRTIIRKVLKLNFYRPGDEEVDEENKVYFGLPGRKDFEWVYL